MMINVRWFNQTQGVELPLRIAVANSFKQRLIGLISYSALQPDEALYFPACNSIHTFFMRFKIDCVFLDRNLRVVEIVQNLAPNRILLPRLNARSVLELAAGQAQRLPLKTGDQIHVSH